jgi:hypothetical protein
MEWPNQPKVRTPGIDMRQRNLNWETTMSTLQIIRKFAFTAVLAAAALIAPATQAADESVHEATAARDSAVASLGQIIVTAPRIAKLGVLVLSARRETAAAFADLGAMTVHASRDALATVADLGTMTVTAPSQGAVIVAGGTPNRSWD